MDLSLESNEAFAALLLDQSSGNTSSCADEKLVDTADIANSLFLKLIDGSNAAEECTSKMPLGSNGLSADDYAVVEDWITYLVDNFDVESDGETVELPVAANYQVPVITSVNKVKSFLVGEAVTNDELIAATSESGLLDEAVLKNQLIDSWLNDAEFEPKFLNRITEFLEISLQQRQLANNQYRPQLGNIRGQNSNINSNMMDSNLQEMFVRTALDIIENDKDYRGVVTTREWMMTTATLAALVYADSPRSVNRADFKTILGLEAQHYEDWNLVEIRQGSESATFSYDADFVSQMSAIVENGDSIDLLAPRVGFFNSIVFMHTWETNSSNQFRLNLSQTFLAALNVGFQIADTTPENNLSNLDDTHAEPGSDCFACHRMIDPARNVFLNSYDVDRQRTKTTMGDLQGDFAFQGVSEEVQTMDDFAELVANHPRFSLGLTEKLCHWANGTECTNTDELERVAQVFVDSGHNFKTVIKELFSSSIVTAASITLQEGSLDTVSYARQRLLCENFEARIKQIREGYGYSVLDETSNRVDICRGGQPATLSGALPIDGYQRGVAALDVSIATDPFHSLTLDGFCSQTAPRVVGGQDDRTFKTGEPEAEQIEKLVQYIMGIPESSVLYPASYQAIDSIYRFSRATPVCTGDNFLPDATEFDCGLGLSRANATRVAWKAACMSPSMLGLGL